MPDENLTYIDVGLSYNDSRPTKPLDLTATRADEAVALAWKTPASAGIGPITEYKVTGKSLTDGSDLPEVRIPADQATATTYLGLTGGEPYEFSVAAVTPSGTGDSATVVATPRAKVPALVKGETVGVPADKGGDKAKKRMERKLHLKIRVQATNRIQVQAFGEAYGNRRARRSAAGPA